LGGFGQCVQIAQHGILRFRIRCKRLVAGDRVLFNAGDALLDVN
jgi:hypothetical protein